MPPENHQKNGSEGVQLQSVVYLKIYVHMIALKIQAHWHYSADSGLVSVRVSIDELRLIENSHVRQRAIKTLHLHHATVCTGSLAEL